MRACLGTLEVETPVVFLVVRLLSINVPIVEHVDSNKISHFVVHLFPLAQLEGEVLVLVFLVTWV